MYIYRFRVYQIHLSLTRHIIEQSGSRIYIHRRTDNNEYIRFFHVVDSRFNLRNRFSKPNNKRTKLSAVTGLISKLHFIFIRLQFFYVMGVIRVATGADLRQFTMQVNNAPTPGTFMQIVNILSHNRHIEVRFQFSKPEMSVIRPYLQ